MNVPLTVITPVRNGMPFLPAALASIASQDSGPLEWIVVDDGSTDGTQDFVRSVDRVPARLLQFDGIGPAAARNAGIRECTTDLIAFIDADDLWPPGSLLRLGCALEEHPEAGFAQGLIQNFREPHPGMIEFITPPYRFISLTACLWRSSVFETAGLLDEDLRLCEDLDFMMRCWEKDIVKAEVNRVTLQVRRHPNNTTRGLSGAGFGTVKAFKKKIDRIRRGEHDPSAPRHVAINRYIGVGPQNQDGSPL